MVGQVLLVERRQVSGPVGEVDVIGIFCIEKKKQKKKKKEKEKMMKMKLKKKKKKKRLAGQWCCGRGRG